MKCRDCGEEKDEEEFNWRYKVLGIRSPICKECTKGVRRKHYESHAEEEKQRTYTRKKQAIDEANRFIYEYLSYQKCVDCGEYDFTVLTFDHVRGEKKMDISQMAAQGYSIEAIKEEILKTEVVCANCHMQREQKRRGGGRFEKFWPKRPQDE